MNLGTFLEVFAKIFNILSWPSFTLIYPLYASIQAIESDSDFRNQKCLTYWVLFCLITILESALSNLLKWLPFWSYTKGIATVLLVLPNFGGASYIYHRLLRPYVSQNSQIWNVLFIMKNNNSMLSEQHNFRVEVERNIIDGEAEELEKHVIFQGYPEPDTKEGADKPITSPKKVQKEWSCALCLGYPEPDTKEGDARPITSPKKVQKEWSCALCLVSTTSEYCLKKHLQGKKHKAQSQALRATKTKDNSPFVPKRANGMAVLKNINQTAWTNLQKWGGLLSPVAGSIRWCTWQKPEKGWTKLNTDGSVDRENAGFGGLLRDHKGHPICAFVSKAPGDDVFLVELWAIWRGLVLALGLEIKVIWVESDSMSVVKTINREQTYNPKAESCLNDIWKLLKKFKKYQVSHSWREANRAADHLSKTVYLESDVVLWPADFPAGLWKIIKDDAKGKIYFRG